MSTAAESIDTRLNSLEFWAKPRAYRREAFKWLRNNTPISWNEPPDSLDPNLQNAKSFWSIVKHAHLREISRNVEVFSSAEGVFIDDFPQLETMLSFIVTDPPRHTELRNIVTVAFTPRNIRKMTDSRSVPADRTTALATSWAGRCSRRRCGRSITACPTSKSVSRTCCCRTS